MCFTERQSYINTILLLAGAFYSKEKWRLAIFLIFLSMKDLIQGLSYNNIKKRKSTQLLTSLSWIHICFQPLFVNVFFSHFDKKFKYWNHLFILCILYALYNITKLNEFDIQNDKDCIKKSKYDDFCSKKTESYIGTYHLGYKFSTDENTTLFIYKLLMFLPALFTKSKYVAIGWISFVGAIYTILRDNNIGDGEKAAIWCFSSILVALPMAIYTVQKNI